MRASVPADAETGRPAALQRNRAEKYAHDENEEKHPASPDYDLSYLWKKVPSRSEPEIHNLKFVIPTEARRFCRAQWRDL
jgi:hypothetical protein